MLFSWRNERLMHYRLSRRYMVPMPRRVTLVTRRDAGDAFFRDKALLLDFLCSDVRCGFPGGRLRNLSKPHFCVAAFRRVALVCDWSLAFGDGKPGDDDRYWEQFTWLLHCGYDAEKACRTWPMVVYDGNHVPHFGWRKDWILS